MKKISDLLGRFAELAKTSDDAKKAIVDALVESGIRVDSDFKKITIRGTVATVRFSPIQKSEVALRQGKIISTLQKNPLTKHIKVVR